MPQVSASPSPYFKARLLNLEEGHMNLCGDVDSLTEMYHSLCSSVDRLKKGGWGVTLGPFQEQDLTQSHQSAVRFKQELENLSREVHESVDGVADIMKANGTTTIKTNGSIPPHLRATNGSSNGSKSVPPHLRGKNAGASDMNGTKNSFSVSSSNSRLVTDGPVDTVAERPAAIPSPPSSPVTVVQPDIAATSALLLDTWKPHYISTLPALPKDFVTKIPAASDMVTFHPQLLDTALGGSDWSPGLRFVISDNTCILKNRTYYLLNPNTEPFLPSHPGEHGAKLTAFFNQSPEELHNLPDDVSSYEDVPMFIERQDSSGKVRYAYFGHYSQTRWSDKLDMDTMKARVPEHVKDFWANELTATLRPAWVTEQLKKHFFKKPEYGGRLYPTPDEDTATMTSEEEVKLNEEMIKDVSKYVGQLREWEREADMKTAMIKKQFILDAFDAADADEPPALRLWWEYLECVSWRKDFYDFLATIQSRRDDLYNQ